MRMAIGASNVTWCYYSDLPPRSASFHLVQADCLAKEGTEPEVTEGVFSKTVVLGPDHPLTHSATDSTGQGLGA